MRRSTPPAVAPPLPTLDAKSLSGLEPNRVAHFHIEADWIARCPLAGPDAERSALQRQIARERRALAVGFPRERHIDRLLHPFELEQAVCDVAVTAGAFDFLALEFGLGEFSEIEPLRSAHRVVDIPAAHVEARKFHGDDERAVLQSCRIEVDARVELFERSGRGLALIGS